MSLITEDNVDYRTINPAKNPDEKIFLNRKIQRWIELGLIQLRKIIPIWDLNELYYENQQSPTGFSTNALAQFVESNSANIKKDDNNFIYYKDNHIKDVYDGRVGEYINLKKSYEVKSDDNPRNNRIEGAVQKFFEQHEYEQKTWQNAKIPAIMGTIMNGMAGTYNNYNPLKNRPNGLIENKFCSARDILLDTNSREAKFLDSRRRIRMFELPMSEAKKTIKGFGADTSNLRGDTDYANQHNIKDDGKYEEEEFVTIYFVEFKCSYIDDYKISDHYNINLSQDIKGNTLKGEEEYYFYALYTEQTGVFYYAENPYKQWFTTIWYNKKSNLRLYPISDVEDLITIQDIINITKSLVLDNARQQNIIRAAVKKGLRTTYGETYDVWERYGGTLEVDDDVNIQDAVQMYKIQELPSHIYQFMDIATETMKNVSQRYNPLKGEYPEQKLSGVAINELSTANRRTFSYLDEHFNWAGNEDATMLYKMAEQNFTEEYFVEVTNANKDEAGYFPINGVYTLQGYVDILKQSGLMSEDEVTMIDQLNERDPAFIAQLRQLIRNANNLFQKTNDVEIVYKNEDDNGVELDPITVYTEKSMVFINHLGGEKMKVKIFMDWDKEKDEYTDKQMAGLLFDKFGLPLLGIFLETAGGHLANRKDEIIKLVNESDKLTQLAQEITKRGPEFLDIIMKLMQQFDQSGKAPAGGNGGGSPAPAVP